MNIRRSLATAVFLATAAAPVAAAAPAFAEGTPAGLEQIDQAGATVADEENIATIKALLVWPNDYLLTTPSKYLRDRVAAALAGTPEGRAEFVTKEMAQIRMSDARVAIVRTLNGAGPVLQKAARAAFDSHDLEMFRAFLETGQYVARAEDENRAELQKIIDDPNTGRGVRDGAKAALAGTGADVANFLKDGIKAAQLEDDRVAVLTIMHSGGPAVKKAGSDALNGTVEDIRDFLKTGQYVARAEDEGRAELRRLLEDPKTGPAVRAAAAKALAGSAADVQAFLTKDLARLAEADDRLLLAQIMTRGGPEVKDAANTAMNGSVEDVRRFLKEGQYVARAKDEANAKAAAEAEAAKNKPTTGTTVVTPATDTTRTVTTPTVTDGQPVAGGRLAYTGTDAPLGQLGAAGAAAIALGTGALIATRRRTNQS
ncbi:ALF repeat-containing protein [Kitasatospora sp. NPDC004289]